MKEKTLKDKAIDINGNKYILVSDRVIEFNKLYPKGNIETRLISSPEANLVVMKAKVTPDITTPARFFTGYSQAKWGEGYVNKTSALENAETSAVGRALGMMGIGVIDSIASADEMNKASFNDRKSSFSVSETQATVKEIVWPTSWPKEFSDVNNGDLVEANGISYQVYKGLSKKNGKHYFGLKSGQDEKPFFYSENNPTVLQLIQQAKQEVDTKVDPDRLPF